MALRPRPVPSPAAARPHTLLATALCLLAGAPAGLAQFTLDPTRPAQPGDAPSAPGGMRDPMGGADAGDLGEGVKVNEHMLVDIHVQDEDLATVLQMLSIQSQRNIVASKNVSATVTANFYGVSFFEALDGILHVNGYGYMERGNFIYVYTLEELEEIEKASRQLVQRIVKLNYLNSVDAAEFAKPLLSPDGQIKTNGKVEAFTLPDDGPVGDEQFANESTVVIFDYEENVQQVVDLLGQLDTRPAQVLIEATILQTSLNEANAFGIDFTILGSIDFGDFVGVGGPTKVVDNLITGKGATLSGPVQTPAENNYGSGVQSTPGHTTEPGTLKVGVISGDFAAFLRLLDEVSDTTILSRPNLLTLNRQPARVLVGRKVGYLNTTSTDTATTQTVEFLDTGTQLHVRPFVSSDGTIRMELKPQVSEAIIRSATDATGAAVTIPDEITNELVANVMVRDGQTIVLGGLFRESTEATRRQVPVMGDLPLIGAAFRGREDEVQRSEIIFMITPSLVNDEILDEQGRRASEVVVSARTGAREGLLPFSRDRQAGQLLVQAQQQTSRGETEAALLSIRRSLALKPQQPEAVFLRERLLKDKTVWPSNSLMEEILHAELEDMLKAAPAQGALAPAAPPAPPGAGPGGNAPETAAAGAGSASTDPAHGGSAPAGSPDIEASALGQHGPSPDDAAPGAALRASVDYVGPAEDGPSLSDPAADPSGTASAPDAAPAGEAGTPSAQTSPAPVPASVAASAPPQANSTPVAPEPFTFDQPSPATQMSADDIRLLFQLSAAEWMSFNNRSDWPPPVPAAGPDSPAAPSDRRRGEDQRPKTPAAPSRTVAGPTPDDPEPSDYTQADDPPEADKPD